jgi:hypothetical protein
MNDGFLVGEVPLYLKELAKFVGFDIFMVRVNSVLRRCIEVFSTRRLNVFYAKTSCAKLVKTIASQLHALNKKDIIDIEVDVEIVANLKRLANDRIPGLADAAARALREWD